MTNTPHACFCANWQRIEDGLATLVGGDRRRDGAGDLRHAVEVPVRNRLFHVFQVIRLHGPDRLDRRGHAPALVGVNANAHVGSHGCADGGNARRILVYAAPDFYFQAAESPVNVRLGLGGIPFRRINEEIAHVVHRVPVAAAEQVGNAGAPVFGFDIEQRHFETRNRVIAGAKPVNDVLIHAVEQEFGAQRVLTDEQGFEFLSDGSADNGDVGAGALAQTDNA